ncbi:Uncharacterised protein [Burkholderia pseudomallei]|nr:Uncharacterised protein [Burkholderia pseudomallei]
MWPTGSAIVVSPPLGQRDDLVFTANIGSRVSSSGTDCDPPLVNHQYIVSFNAAPEVSGQALQTSFQVLVAALVLALLLESAFALLFNWRPFNVLFVGRAWRSPIMLFAAWLVVSQFKFDLMAQLFNAYYPQPTQPTNSWGTTFLTAMILAGGSVGVNRILTTLGFRSPMKDGEEPPKLDETHAWIAVEVEPVAKKQRVVVNVTEATPPVGASIETAVGIAGNPRPSLRSIFTGNVYRVPSSGGLQVLTSKFYTITIRDLDKNKDYDVTGKELTGNVQPTTFRFGPRAMLDFRVKLPN